jgi:hypothetical protein
LTPKQSLRPNNRITVEAQGGHEPTRGTSRTKCENGWLLWFGLLLLLIGSVGFFLLRALRLLDRSVKLSLTTEGVRDHRNGTLIRWEEIRGLRHEVRRSRGPIFLAATLYVKVSEGGEAREVGIDILDLDFPPWRIEELVDQRRKDSLAARWKVVPAEAEAPAVRQGD